MIGMHASEHNFEEARAHVAEVLDLRAEADRLDEGDHGLQVGVAFNPTDRFAIAPLEPSLRWFGAWPTIRSGACV